MYYTDQFMTILKDGFIQRLRYMDVYMPHSARVGIGQLRVSSHKLEIKARRGAHIPREHMICTICRAEVKSKEHYVCSTVKPTMIHGATTLPCFRGNLHSKSSWSPKTKETRAYHDLQSYYTALFSRQPTLKELMESRDQDSLDAFFLRFRDMEIRCYSLPVEIISLSLHIFLIKRPQHPLSLPHKERSLYSRQRSLNLGDIT
ncbi:hypothetical protein L7F22_034312 [Adiantum nelumboides]|nr:hypothetical protein [Adiantum nelumboides]